jgi:5-(carboxyamino)imidazole ribonucleotide mutase
VDVQWGLSAFSALTSSPSLPAWERGVGGTAVRPTVPPLPPRTGSEGDKTRRYNSTMQPLVGVIMGSQSDWETMRHAVETLESLGVPYEVQIVSAHRTPDKMFEYAHTAESRGLEVIIAGAGGAAHLPGMTAAKTTLPVLGVPIESHALKGLDSLLSIVQMPAGVPVGTLAIGKAGAINAALLATAILANKYPQFRDALHAYRQRQTQAVLENPDPRTE